ncbi:tubulin monoglutamylase TTLL4 [Microcaecilia unicolor]|uniref:Tubulin polyglutamylase TTLL4 n=1 Tax=Microcaecilia unicolor TaxID=1415580 RepID=A0A6P7YCA5_9AMPH|nr:tubulin polyglutamylase TTLL4 [Microcaecilia unicolor]XP_030065122.1 tubulin polyglutamylase TTLL4 [Microcaecilia unicolor]XP_030065123.1 tubulin polyglutamylase TTLL4 [Microcaecilia unicolor]XP_030065124.1 tubulin polyglutamylase TTLL4 [Microcaecilia unicolor]
MASASTEPYSISFGKNNHHRSQNFRVQLAGKPQESHARSLPVQEVKSIWRLEKKNVNPVQDQKLGHSGIPPQRTLSFYSDPFCNARIAPPPLIAAVHNTSKSLSRSPSNSSEGTLPSHQPTHGHGCKSYQKLESLCLKFGGLGRRDLSSPYRNPLNSSITKGNAVESAMSSCVNQYLPQSATVELPNPGVRSSPPISSGKLISNSFKPTLNTNLFLRPSSAKVPSNQSRQNRKVKTSHVPQPSAPEAWHHSGGTGDGIALSLPSKPLSTSPISLEQTTNVTTALYDQSVTSPRLEKALWQTEEDGKSQKIFHARNKSQKIFHARNKEVKLTEAVKKVMGNSWGKNMFSDLSLDTDQQANVSLPNDSSSGSNRGQIQTTSYASPRQEDNQAHPHLMENRNLRYSSLNMGNSNVCTKRISAHLLASSTDSPENGALSTTRTAVPVKSKDPTAKGAGAQQMNVSDMTAQISTIELEKKHHSPQRSKWEADSLQDLNTETDWHLPEHEETEDVERELPENLEHFSSQEDNDDESDCSSEGGALSSGSVTAISRECESVIPAPKHEDKIIKPALTLSIFPNVPPTLYFATRDEMVELLPWVQRKLMRWKMSNVTPNIVKQVVLRSHFRITKRNYDWLGCWGHHMKSPGFKTIREYQKLNHFPGSFQIGRKDRLWRNLSRMQARFGKKEFNFFPQSFILPQDVKLLKKTWEEGGTRQKWIVKPPASARGIGIQVIHKWSQLPKRRPLLVQRYLHKPYLISGSKFDLRIYVYVTSYDPLRIYVFTDGLVRFASCKYSSSTKTLNNKFMHLTNYSVNKKNTEYESNTDETACQGHKWALKALWSYLNQKGVNSDKIWEKIKDIVIKTVIASEPYVTSLVKMYVQKPYCCHELFGFDIMLDENLKPWILEVNISPSLHSNSALDINIKGQMIRDLLNLAGFVLPPKEDIIANNVSASSSSISLSSLEKEKPRVTIDLFPEEKMKRAYYLSQKLPDEDFYSSILDTLTPDDVRILVETEDEFTRRGCFERVFPSPISSRYLRFFEQLRYLNILTDQWEQKYYWNKERGIDLLRRLCLRNFHMGSVSDSYHLWSVPKCHLRNDLHLNGFSKPEVAKLGKPSLQKEKNPSSGDDLLQSFRLTCQSGLPVIRSVTVTEKNHLPQSLSSLSDIALLV